MRRQKNIFCIINVCHTYIKVCSRHRPFFFFSIKSVYGFVRSIGQKYFSSNKPLAQKSNETGLVKKGVNAYSYPNGTGGRSSVSGNTVTVFGATGMMGRILLNRLGKDGSQIVVPYRGDIHDTRPLKLCADLGQMYFQVGHCCCEQKYN